MDKLLHMLEILLIEEMMLCSAGGNSFNLESIPIKIEYDDNKEHVLMRTKDGNTYKFSIEKVE